MTKDNWKSKTGFSVEPVLMHSSADGTLLMVLAYPHMGFRGRYTTNVVCLPGYWASILTSYMLVVTMYTM